MSPRVSIIIVDYRSKFYLDQLLESLRHSTFTDFETVIVDNSKINIGYGAGVNKGAVKAKGEYLFVLNPDTLVFPDTLSRLVNFLDRYPLAGIVAPLLSDSNHRPYPLQGSRELTPLSITFAQSLIHKLWSTNPVARHYWLMDWDKRRTQQVDVVPGTAFLIRKSVFQTAGGFDPRFFLYFEESDLCRRVSLAGWQIYMLPSSRLVHFWAKSTPNTPLIRQIFSASRFYYFKKHFGITAALLIEFFCRPNLIFLSAIFILGTYLRFTQIPKYLPLIGDQTWFYLSAADALLSGKFPLLGITSSITWLHQGPLYTFMLMPSFLFSNFSPAAPAYITGFITSLNIILLYYLAAKLFNRTAGIFAAAIFAVHPFIVLQSRFPYHTTPLFLFITVFFLLKNRPFLAGLFLGLLYQLHLLTIIFWLFLRPKMLPGFVLGILPFLLVGPIQTFGIFAWLAKHLVTGFSGSYISDAYLVVLTVPIILSVSFLISRIPKKWSYLITLFIILYSIFNQQYSKMTSYQNTLKNPESNEYVSWWLSRR